MQRSELVEIMGTLKLSGMKSQFDEIVQRTRKRQRSIEEVLGELLQAEIAYKQTRSIS